MTEQTQKPVCVGITMDGNRRWAKARHLPTLAGHKAGRDTFMQVIEWAFGLGVENLIFYTFSTENWKRTEEEVGYLLGLFRESAREQAKVLEEKNIRVRFVGDLQQFPDDIQRLMADIEERTKTGSRGTVALAVSYGGRAELVAACNQLRGLDRDVVEADVQAALWTHDLPDPDMLIRTGGQQRLSNFLTWQSVYSELFFTDTLWPDFTQEEFKVMLNEFSERKRNFGT